MLNLDLAVDDSRRTGVRGKSDIFNQRLLLLSRLNSPIVVNDRYDSYSTIDKFTSLATKEKISANDFNLNIPRYIDTFEEKAAVDMEAVKRNIYQDENPDSCRSKRK